MYYSKCQKIHIFFKYKILIFKSLIKHSIDDNLFCQNLLVHVKCQKTHSFAVLRTALKYIIKHIQYYTTVISNVCDSKCFADEYVLQ